MNSPLQQDGEVALAPAIAPYTPLKLFLAVSQQRGGKGAGDRLLAFAGVGGVADCDDALPGPRQLASGRRPKRNCAPVAMTMQSNPASNPDTAVASSPNRNCTLLARQAATRSAM